MRSREFTIPTTYVLYVDNKPIQKFDSRREALYTHDMIAKKFPNRNFSVHAEICTDKELTELLQPELTDGKGFEITKHDELGLEWTAASQGNNELVIEVKQHGNTIAQAIFRTTENDDDLNSDDTWVDKNYRRMGIATKMYNWAQELGNTVLPSKFLSTAGKKFWKARAK